MNDKVFLITGASTGIGAATARQAADAGFKVVLAARTEDKLRALADETGGLAVRCDVTEWEDQQALVARTLDEYGRLDVAFANAGFGGARGFTSASPEEWKSMVLTNVYGAALTIRAAYDALVAVERPPAAHLVGRRPARAPGLLLLRRPSTRSRPWARPPGRS